MTCRIVLLDDMKMIINRDKIRMFLRMQVSRDEVVKSKHRGKNRKYNGHKDKSTGRRRGSCLQ